MTLSKVARRKSELNVNKPNSKKKNKKIRIKKIIDIFFTVLFIAKSFSINCDLLVIYITF